MGIEPERWDHLPPELSDNLIEQWEQKQTREDLRFGQLMLTVASAMGMKRNGGGRLSIKDFVPEYVAKKMRKDPKLSAMQLEIALKAAAKKHIKPNGQS